MRKNLKAIAIIGVLLLLAALATSALAAPPDQAQGSKSIVDLATEQGKFTTLLGALEKANLVDRLKGEGPFTVFAPADEAFARLPQGTMDSWFANSEALTSVLLDHVVEGRLTAAELAKMDTVKSLTGRMLDITADGDKIKVNGANIITADLAASNGLIHVIDAVLVPPTNNQAVMSEGTMAGQNSASGPAQASTAAGCAENYVVQASDSLSQVAEKFLGTPAYQSIVEATNTAAASNPAYVAIKDPNIINVGETLCIPGSPPAQAAAVGGTGMATPAASATPAANQPQVEVPPGKGVLLFENYAFVDLVFDLSGPKPDTGLVVPNGKQQFVLEPGEYTYTAHQPGGDFAVAPGGFTLKVGEVVRLSCSDSPHCALLPLEPAAQPAATAAVTTTTPVMATATVTATAAATTTTTGQK